MKNIVKWIWIPIYVGVLLSNVIPVLWVKHLLWGIGLVYILVAIFFWYKHSIRQSNQRSNTRFYFTLFAIAALALAYTRTRLVVYPKAKAKIESYSASIKNKRSLPEKKY